MGETKQAFQEYQPDGVHIYKLADTRSSAYPLIITRCGIRYETIYIIGAELEKVKIEKGLKDCMDFLKSNRY